MAQPVRQMVLSGWGRTNAVSCAVHRPESGRQLAASMQQAPQMSAYGMGRSYGDAALNPSATLLTTRLKRLIAFDVESGVVTAQAGLTLDELLPIVIKQGWFVPVLPGTRFATIGGAVASNVHGKNHYKQGGFAQWVKAMQVRLADGRLLTCSPSQEETLFWATLGGMGLTGVIETVTLQLQRIHSLSLRTQTKTVASLQEMLRCFDEAKDDSDYMVGWIDHFAGKQSLGQGVFEKAVHIDEAQGGTPITAYEAPKAGRAVPFVMPSFLLNRWSMALYNKHRFGRYSASWREEVQDFAGFFHPLDNMSHWNRLYGKKGFYQYQLVLPESPQVGEQLTQLLTLIQEAGLFSYLAVLKYHGKADASLLGFPMQGYSLALDFPASKALPEFVRRLNQRVIDCGGRVYLAKDALLQADEFERMYEQQLPAFREALQRYNPTARISSQMAERLGMHGAEHATKGKNSEEAA